MRRMVRGLMICLGLWAAAALPAEAGQNTPEITLSDVLKVAAEMSQEDLKQITYLYARLGNRTYAEPLAARVFAQDPTDLRLLLAMASMYLGLRDAGRTIEYAERILQAYPEDRQGLFFLAAGHQTAGNAAKARDILIALERLYPQGARFPFALDLASASLQSGDWQRAMRSYQRVLRDSQLDPALRAPVRRAIDGIYREYKPALRAEAVITDAGTGEVREYGGRYSRMVTQTTRISAEARRFETEIDGTLTTRRDRSAAELYEVSVSQRLSGQIGVAATGRVFDDEIGYGGRLFRQNGPGRRQELSFESQAPATDSLNLRYLAGTEKRLNLLVVQALPYRLSMRANAFFRKAYVGIHRLGMGGGADWELSKSQRLAGADVFFSWRGAYSKLNLKRNNPAMVAGLPYLPPFGPSPEVVEGLSTERIHREGVGVLLTRGFNNRWVLSAAGGVDYFFFRRELAWNGGVGLVWRPIKRVDLAADLAYSSADSQGNQNADNLRALIAITIRH